MKLRRWLRRNWREGLFVLLLALPWVALLGFGFLWLAEQGHVLPYAGAAAVLGLLAWPLRRAIRRRAGLRAGEDLAGLTVPAADWTARGTQAWADVQALANGAPVLDFTDRDAVLALARQALALVARRFHPDVTHPEARFTLPELLLLAEQVMRDIRREAVKHVPGARSLRLDHLLWLQRHGTRAQALYEQGYNVWRVIRFLRNPITAVAAEVQNAGTGSTGGMLTESLRGYGTRLLVLEVGRAAIDLYSGKLRLSEEELVAAGTADRAKVAGGPEGPVRIVLAGQVNAGKSSLVNALAREVLCEVGPVPTPAGSVEHVLRGEGARPEAILIDTPGIGPAPASWAEVLDRAADADLVLWVASAVQPARAPDAAAIAALRARLAAAVDRRPPPLLVALTHVDQLRPAAEWAPPYDVAGDRPKERTMREAAAAVARTLGVAETAVVCVAAPPDAPAFGYDRLWVQAAALGEARLRRLERLRLASGGFSIREAAAQTGRLLGRAVRQAVKR